MKIVEVSNLSKKYTIINNPQENILRNVPDNSRLTSLFHFKNNSTQDFWALKNVSFSMDRGDVLGAVGPNGSGKSTLLKLLSKITNPTSGSATIRGRVASLLEIGTGFNPELSGRENIYFNAAIMGMTKREIDGKFDQIVSFSEIGKFIDTPVKRYSSGMYTRLAFSVAAYLEAEILLVDEVLAVGDMEFQKKCLGKMEEMSHAGRTVIFVSHNMGAIKSLCQKAIFLNDGEVVCYDETSKVIDKYIGQTVAGSGENIFENNELKMVQIKKVFVLDKNGKKTIEIDISEPFSVFVDCEIREDLHEKSYVCVSFYDLNNNLILQNMDVDTNEKYYQNRPKGLYSIKFLYPENIFNNFKCRISVFAGIYTKQHFDKDRNIYSDQKDNIFFEFIKANHFSKKFFSGRRGGYFSVPFVSHVKICPHDSV